MEREHCVLLNRNVGDATSLQLSHNFMRLKGLGEFLKYYYFLNRLIFLKNVMFIFLF